jgi:hypothetical protein
MARQERPVQRSHLRFPCSLELQGRKAAPLGNPQKAEPVVRGQIENIGRGGVCLLSSRPIPTSSLVRCEIEVSPTRAAIPTLMQVRWAQRTSTNGRFRIGLQFLL